MTTRPTLLITGATDGIGRELARIYTMRGARVLALGRRPYSSLHDPPVYASDYIQADLAQPGSGRAVAAWLRARAIDALDVLVHNAGTGYHGRAAAQLPDDIDRLLNVNLWSPVELTHALLPWLRSAHGRLVFISSVAAGLPGPDYAVYTATKAGLEGFARALRVELAGDVAVQVIRPGATRTGMHAKMGLTTAEMDWTRFPPAAAVAARIAAGIDGPPRTRTIGAGNSLLYAAGTYVAAPLDFALRHGRDGASQLPVAAEDQPPTAVVTGGADGIGRALVTQLARDGYRVLGLDVDTGRALAVRKITGATFVMTDLATDPGRGTALTAARVFAPAQLVIHNAGISCVGRFAASDLAQQQAVFDLNLRAPLQMTAVILRDGLLARAGTLVFLSSLSRYTGYPGAAVYAATKDALAAYGRSLRADLGHAANVLTVFPGPTRTAHARRYSPDNSREARRMPPDTLAKAIAAALAHGRGTLIPGAGNRLFAALGTLAPAVMDVAMRKTILEKLEAVDV